MADKKATIIVEAQDRASGVFEKIGNKTREFSNTLKSAAFVGAATVLSGIAAVGMTLAGAFVRLSTKAMEAEAQTKKLNSALVQTGLYTAEAMKSAEDYATALSKVTVYDDDAIKGAESLLIRMARLKGEGLEKATQAAADFAAVAGIDLNQAAMLLGKTIGGNTNLLKRYGLEVEGAKGSNERLQSVLESVNLKMGGEAKSAAETTTGSLKQMKNEIDNLEEAIGLRLLPIYKEFLDLIKSGAEITANFIGDDKGKTKQYYQDIINQAKLSIEKREKFIADHYKVAMRVDKDFIEKQKIIILKAETELSKIKTDENKKILTSKRQQKVQEAAIEEDAKEEQKKKDKEKTEEKKKQLEEINKIERERQQKAIKDEELYLAKIKASREVSLWEEIERNKKLITNAKLTGDRKEEIEKRIAGLQEQLRKKTIEAEIEKERIILEEYQKAMLARINLAEEVISEYMRKQESKTDEENAINEEQSKAMEANQEKINQVISAQKDKEIEDNKQKLEQIDEATSQHYENIAEEQKSGREQLWQNLLDLEKSGIGTLADMGKAFAVFDIAMKTQQAIMNAYAQLGPIFGSAAAVALALKGADAANQVTGNTIKFAEGGSFVTDKPTNIPMSNGRMATVGEAGPERVDVTPIRDSNRRSRRNQSQATQINLQVDKRTFAKVMYDINQKKERGIY